MSSDIHALSGAYAVDALDDAERAEFEQHLATCEACRQEVADLQAAAVEIAATTEQIPPPSLRASVLAGIADVRPLPPTHPEPAADNVRPLRRRLWQQVGLAAAAAAIVAGGTTVALHPWDSSSVAPPTAGDQVIHAADVQRYAGQVAGGGTVTVYRSVALNSAVVVAKGIQQAPAGHVYELWLLAPSGTMKRAGLFENGTDLTQVVTGNAGPARALGITVEKAGGSDAPTTKPIALVPLTT
ncbi:MAG TPA: anti-sigma factor [Nocardioides sp.]|nr:anti-sigma factor [Nocardioides sp.]